jgi:branched-chain amino acid transport system ATP-binding protein
VTTTASDATSHVAAVGLDVTDVSVDFGGVHALRGVSLLLRQGQLVGLIGPNGAGKTTLLNCMSGLIKPSRGSVAIDGEIITSLRPHERASRGILRTFQNIRLFKRLTALENVEAGALAAGRVPRSKAPQVAATLLERVGMPHLADRYAEGLSYGDQRRLEVARALSAAPRFLLLDEPAAGMNEVESKQIGMLIQGICEEEGCGVLLVEHDLRLIMGICQYVCVLNEGSMISRGSPEEVRADPAVITAYIGEEV